MSWIDSLLPASYNGIPFKVLSTEFKTGRRVDNHEFYGNNNNYPEDLGRKTRAFSFEAYVVGDDCYARAQALQLMFDSVPGPGILVHPYLGIREVQARDFGLSTSVENGRMVTIHMDFIESTPLSALGIALSTIGIVTSLAQNLSGSSQRDFQNNVRAVNAASSTVAATSTMQQLTASITSYADDPTRALNAVKGIGYIFDANVTFGRYSYGNLTTVPPALSSVDPTLSLLPKVAASEAALLSALNTSRAAIEAAAAELIELLNPLSTDASVIVPAVQNLTEAFRSADNDSSDAIRLLSGILTGLQNTPLPSGATVNSNVLTQSGIYAAMCRQAGIYSLSLACSTYQPLSSTDANNIISVVTPILDYEIEFCGVVGNDATFNQLRLLKAAVVSDLQTRGSTLPELITITRPISLPAEVIANQLYGDGSRADELVMRNNPVNPLFMPLSLECLSR